MKLLTKKSYGLDNVFYMVCVNEKADFWNVMTKDSHYVVIATAGYQNTLNCIYKMVQRYKTLGALNKALANVEYKHIIKDKQKVAENLRISKAYEEDVYDTVQRAMADVNEQYNRTGKFVPKEIINNKEENEPKKEEKPVELRIKKRKPIMKLKL